MDTNPVFYTWRSCNTCRDAKKSLDSAGVEVDERDFFADRLTRSELETLTQRVPADELFSWRSPSAKPYRERKDNISSDELVSLMLEEPRLIRRPIVLPAEGAAIIGHDAAAYSALAT